MPSTITLYGIVLAKFPFAELSLLPILFLEYIKYNGTIVSLKYHPSDYLDITEF